MPLPNCPCLYQIDTGSWMTKLSRLSKTNEETLVEKSIIVRYDSFNDLKPISINYLIPRANAC